MGSKVRDHSVGKRGEAQNLQKFSGGRGLRPIKIKQEKENPKNVRNLYNQLNKVLPAFPRALHNCPVRSKLGNSWIIVHSLPTSKSFFLKNFLERKFPKLNFEYKKFKGSSTEQTAKSNSIAGVILELKSLNKTELKVVDRLWRKLKSKPCIFIVTAEGFQLLHQARPEMVQTNPVILSETKSLDYILQLPRFMNEVGRRNRLKKQNERLTRLMAEKMTEVASFKDPIELPEVEISVDVVEGQIGKNICGLLVSLKRWTSLKKIFGELGQTELMQAIGRMINSAVRNSDRVLHWKEDEFLVFLSNTEPRNLSMCRQRVERALRSLSVKANQREIALPFAVRSIEQMSFLH